ncbi:adenosylmethionine decarboxylase [Candidatus Vondammii sp. HM_W22]|uniref:adenosylmethionine decarboxylase n=1 Tax=Candidatus Vondammii sp. HM_W22 TaxID=2687299 RepID=UPI001F12E7EE|nr:adenosylmethionine decarboxylase [Candidatus Vondammii sp. HM_W22]
MNIGRHLIIECQGQHAHLSEKELERLLVSAAKAGSASVLQAYFHPFGTGKGITGVVLLAESHMTVHTWPEHNYAAFDVFMCGDCRPLRAADVITSACAGAVTSVQAIDRGLPFNAMTLSADFPTYHTQFDPLYVG